MGSIREGLLPREGGVVGLVGAGGKTTLMFRLAQELAESGESVLTTTTTKILAPTRKQSANVVVATDVEKLIRKSKEWLELHPHVTAAREDLAGERKLGGFDPTMIEMIMQAGLFQWVLVEADGAAGRPLKAPADHEPVIPPCSCLVIGVVGMDAVGKPLDEPHVFRPEVFSRVSGLPLGSTVTEASIVQLIEHEQGLFKGCPAEASRAVLLNKADDERARQGAQRIASLLDESGKADIEKIAIGAVGNEPPGIASWR